MEVIKTIETLDSLAERSAKDWEMKTRLSVILNSLLNVEILPQREIEEIRDIAEYFKLDLVLEKLSKL